MSQSLNATDNPAAVRWFPVRDSKSHIDDLKQACGYIDLFLPIVFATNLKVKVIAGIDCLTAYVFIDLVRIVARNFNLNESVTVEEVGGTTDFDISNDILSRLVVSDLC